MKKTGTVIGALLFMLLFISGCTKAIPAEEAANNLIDTMIYDQQTEAFQTNFANSEELTEIFVEQRTLFEENFTQGILQTGEAVDEQLAMEISEMVMQQMRETTSYKIKNITETKPIYHVTYEIQGFNLLRLFKESITELLVRIQNDNELVKDQKTLIATTVAIMQEKIPTIEANDTSTEVTLQLKVNRGKWEIVNGQDEALSSLYLAFFSGMRSQEELTNAMTEALSEIEVPSMGEPTN